MKTATKISIAAALVFFTAFTQAQNWQWAEKLGREDYDFGLSINMDDHENCLLSAAIGNPNLGTFDMYFVKMDSSGAITWSLTYGGSANDYGQEMLTDSLGNFYLLGAFKDTLVMGTDTLVSYGDYDMVLAKLDANQNVLWAKHGGSIGREEPFSIKVDQTGNIYMITPFENTASFDATTLVTSGAFDIALVKYDANGNVVWARQAGGGGNDTPISIDLDMNDNIIMGGHFSDTCAFGSTVYMSAGLWDIFLAKYDPSGTLTWSQTYGGTGDDGNTMVRVGSDNNIYLAGIFTSTVNFGSIQLTAAGNSMDLFVAKYETSSGNIVWAKSAGSGSVDVVYNMTLDRSNSLYITGYYGNNAQFGPIAVPGSFDVYVAKYNSNGVELWVKNTIGVGGQHTYEAWGVAERNGNVYVSGSFAGNINFDNSSIMMTAWGSEDIFVAKISQTITAIDEVDAQHSFGIYPNPCNTCNLVTTSSSDNFRLTDVTGRVLPLQLLKTDEGYTFTLPKAGGVYLLTNINSGRTIRVVAE